MKDWWNATNPPQRLVLAGVLATVVGCYLLLVGVALPLALLAVFIIWDASCLMVANAPNYASWNPSGRVSRFIKAYADVAHSIRYGRGQMVLRISVLSLVVIVAVTATVWTVTS